MAASAFFILLVSTLSCYEAQRRPLDPVKMPDHCRKPGEGKGFQIEGEWNEETYPIGKEAILACLPGYTNYRPIKLVCLAGDWWHVGKFQCKAFTCKLPQVDNGRVTYPLKPDYNSNDVIQITCNEGFYITNGESTCTKDDWIPKPTCTEIVCNSYQHVEKGRLISVQAAYKYGEEIDVECDSGYILQTEPNKRRTCTSNGWSPPIRCVAYCEPPPAVRNSILNEQPKSSYAAGEKVTYTCNRGYSLEGSLRGEAQCENTQWLNVPVCRKIGEQCGPPPTIQFGDTTGIRKPSYKSGESVEYRCPNFYILKGETIVRCMNGVWEEAPVCLGMFTVLYYHVHINSVQEITAYPN
ncbi:complement factor H-related protein 1-like [Eleutherodactylus coqui]|uniref:complement factor H-related protein 1-like n=1 Tax=Eleutherodactylus coqui TaxID=57060 RepID=UPI003461AD61